MARALGLTDTYMDRETKKYYARCRKCSLQLGPFDTIEEARLASYNHAVTEDVRNHTNYVLRNKQEELSRWKVKIPPKGTIVHTQTAPQPTTVNLGNQKSFGTKVVEALPKLRDSLPPSQLSTSLKWLKECLATGMSYVKGIQLVWK